MVMDLLAWTIISLQLAFPPAPTWNANSYQHPGLDINGPSHYRVHPATPRVSDISYYNKYYTCGPRVRLSISPCKFNNSFRIQPTIFKYPVFYHF